MKNKTALIAGSTGLVGNELLNLILNDDYYSKVISVVRNSTGISNAKLKEIKIDFENIENYSSEILGNDIFCCLGTTIKKAGSKINFKKVDLDYPLQIAGAALVNGAQQFSVVSSIGADKNSKAFYTSVKGEMEEDLKNLNYFSLNIFRPSLLTGDREEFRLGEKIAQLFMKIFSFLFIGNLKKYKAIEAKTVAAAMLYAAKRNSEGINIFESYEIQKLGGKN
jgi:uncharacterized protein YbjT (DUF2867 family)